MAAVKAWSPRLADDVSVVVLRYLGPGAPDAPAAPPTGA
jgi:hypothetical protein